jgi:hypothetical protein
MKTKSKCEICGIDKKSILHRHHIIPRCDPRCTNSDNNIAIVCPNDHSLIHAGEIIIIGIYFTSNGYELLWFKKGEIPPLPAEHWMIKENPFVVTLNGDEDDLPD